MACIGYFIAGLVALLQWALCLELFINLFLSLEAIEVCSTIVWPLMMTMSISHGIVGFLIIVGAYGRYKDWDVSEYIPIAYVINIIISVLAMICFYHSIDCQDDLKKEYIRIYVALLIEVIIFYLNMVVLAGILIFVLLYYVSNCNS
jgi:hypothetical protein